MPVLSRLLVVAALMLALPAGAAPSPQKVLARASENFAAVKDYSADATVTVQSQTVHIPRSRVRILYKKPDKVRVESSDGFAMLPRQGIFAGDPLAGIRESTNLKLAGVRKLSGESCFVVSGLQKHDGDQVKYTACVGRKSWLVRQITTESGQGAASVSLWYTRVGKECFMPSRTLAKVLPASRDGGVRKDSTMIEVKFSNYKVNTGIDDKVFNAQGGHS
jgi:outer membrane lipoprotein-sorting protein